MIPNPTSSYCPNCDAMLVGPYCYECGQPVPKRITWRSFTSRFFERYLDLDHGIPHTIWELFINPGKVTREYLEGKRSRYTDPVKFMLIAVSLITLLMVNTGMMTEFMAGMSDGAANTSREAQDPELKKFSDGIYTNMLDYMQVWMLIFVPFSTFFGWLIFKRGKYNMAEQFIFMCFVYGMQNWLVMPFWLIFSVFGLTNGWTISFTAALSLGYSIYAFISFYRPSSLALGIFQSIVTIILTYIGFFILMIVIMGIYMIVMVKEGKLKLGKNKAPKEVKSTPKTKATSLQGSDYRTQPLGWTMNEPIARPLSI